MGKSSIGRIKYACGVYLALLATFADGYLSGWSCQEDTVQWDVTTYAYCPAGTLPSTPQQVKCEYIDHEEKSTVEEGSSSFVTGPDGKDYYYGSCDWRTPEYTLPYRVKTSVLCEDDSTYVAYYAHSAWDVVHTTDREWFGVNCPVGFTGGYEHAYINGKEVFDGTWSNRTCCDSCGQTTGEGLRYYPNRETLRSPFKIELRYYCGLNSDAPRCTDADSCPPPLSSARVDTTGEETH